ncbi:MAG: methyltransferase family protein [Gammaproteobacteria bacterium]
MASPDPFNLSSGHFALIAAWLGYAVLHSALASLTIKRWVASHHPGWMPTYRLGFNAVAVLALLPVAVLHYANRGAALWAWEGVFAGLAWLLSGLAIVGFVYSLRFYDGSEFLGLRQWREREERVEDQEYLHISPLHRWVRHPWYTLGLVLIWTRDVDMALLISGSAITIYFALGSRLEERKLLAYHGNAYARYMDRVPGLIPNPWRHLSATEAQAMEALSREHSPEKAI